MPVVKEGESVVAIESGVKNKWRWQWLNETTNIGDEKVPFREWCQKIDRAGVCLCIICNVELKYGTNGKKRLKEHVEQTDHIKNFKIRRSCESVQTQGPTIDQPVCSLVEKKVRLVAFAAEHSLPYSLVPQLLDLSNILSEKKCKALSRLHLSRQAVTYTATHGLAAACKQIMRSKLRSTFFSFNVDEATDNAMDKVVNVIVRYFDDDSVKTEHFASRIVNQATAKNIHRAIVDSMTEGLADDEDEVPVGNLISCLMDNCNTMRGTKNGVHALLKADNPHLLDVAGDTVHTVANAAKILFSSFENYVEDVASDIYYDLQKSPKAKDLFGEIQELLGREKPLQVLRFCPSRFLNMLAVAERLHLLMDDLRIYYYAFLTAEEQDQYSTHMDSIKQNHGVGPEAAARIHVILEGQRKQTKSSTNESRKDRLLNALFFNFDKFSTIVNIYRGVLPHFQGYIKLLQSKAPILHMLLRKMYNLVQDILVLFLQRKSVPDCGTRQLVALKEKGTITDREAQLKDADLGVGEYAYSLYTSSLRKKGCHWAKDVAKKLRKGYQLCAETLLGKLPLRNQTIIRLACLNPEAYSDDKFRPSIINLAKSLPNVVKEEKLGGLDAEARAYSVDHDVGDIASDYDNSRRIDKDYWSKIFRLQTDGAVRYPNLTTLVQALLSIFTGPLVEASFNIMDDIIRPDRARLSIENYEATAVIRSYLSSRGESSLNMEVTPKMAGFVKTSRGRFGKYLEEKKRKRVKDQQRQIASATVSSQYSDSIPQCTPITGISSSGSVNTVTSTMSADRSLLAQSLSASANSYSVMPSTSATSEAAASLCAVQSAGTHPKGGKRAALQSSCDIRQFFKKRRTEMN